MEKVLQQENLAYVNLFDEAGTTQEFYQYSAMPYMVLISPEGKILKINEGLSGKQS